MIGPNQARTGASVPSIPYEQEWEPEDVEEYVPLDIPPQYRTLKWARYDISVRDVWDKFAEGKLQLEPDFQRNYVWDRQRASRFIESVLLALPVPALFISEESDGTWLVIDGHQRFETLFRFLEPLTQQLKERRGLTTKLPPLDALVLSQMEVLVELNAKDIRALTIEDRRRFWDTNLPIIVLAPDSHPDMKYALFARLNLGSMSLNAQELRNCLYRGAYNNLIAKLAERQDFLRL